MTSPISSQNLYGSEASAAEQSRMELQAKLSGLGGINGRQLSPEARAVKLREACEGFESIFIQKMWQEMRNAVPKTGILTGREERFWQDMYDQELSKSMTRAGGIGLADMMYEQLSRNLVSASRSAAGTVQGAAFAPGAAPLVPLEGEDLIDPPSLRAEAIYEAPGARTDGIYENAAPQAAAVPAPGATQPASQSTATAPAANGQKLVADVYTAAPNTTHATAPSERKAADLNQSSGMAMAHQAMREAGDKLGSGAVRPARQPRPAPRQRETDVMTVAAARNVAQGADASTITGSINQGGLVPGSPEALRAALDNARNGTAPGNDQQPLNLRSLVAQVQNQGGQISHGQPVQQTQGISGAANEEAPGLVRVRKTTNIPQKTNGNKNIKRQGQAIRMLNVENVGVNSRQGQGLSAYHAQQDMAAQLNGTGNPQAMPAALAPLGGGAQRGQMAQSPQESAAAIPPLTASDARI